MENGKNIIMKKSKLIAKVFILAFILLYSISFTVVELYFNQKIENILDNQLDNIKQNKEIIFEYNRLIAYDNYEEIISNPKVIEIFQKLKNNPQKRDKLRKELYELLRVQFSLMKKTGVLQLHFVSPDSRSFLRMHKPHKFDDNLTEVRYSYK